MANKKPQGKKRIKKNIPKGIAHIHSTFNNTIVTISDEKLKLQEEEQSTTELKLSLLKLKAQVQEETPL